MSDLQSVNDVLGGCLYFIGVKRDHSLCAWIRGLQDRGYIFQNWGGAIPGFGYFNDLQPVN